MRELLDAVSALAYAMGRTQVHDQLAASLDVKVERAGFALLRALMQCDGSLRSSDLAERLLVRPPHVTRQVAHLEADGLVERARDADDHRVQMVKLTALGRETVEKLDQAVRDRLGRTLEDFPEEDIRAASRVMERMAVNSVQEEAG